MNTVKEIKRELRHTCYLISSLEAKLLRVDPFSYEYHEVVQMIDDARGKFDIITLQLLDIQHYNLYGDYQ